MGGEEVGAGGGEGAEGWAVGGRVGGMGLALRCGNGVGSCCAARFEKAQSDTVLG